MLEVLRHYNIITELFAPSELERKAAKCQMKLRRITLLHGTLHENLHIKEDAFNNLIQWNI